MFTNGDTVSYKYDGNGNLVQRSQNGGVTWDFVYDNAGMLIGSARDDDFWSLYRYDAAGRTLAFQRVAGEHTRSTAFAYNKYEQASHVSITGGSAEITCTKEHPFYLPVKGWTAACELRAGDILVTINGKYVIIEQVSHEILEAPVAVYNFEVEDFHRTATKNTVGRQKCLLDM